MALSLNLPYSVCCPLVRFLRWLSPRKATPEWQDQAVYFDQQFASTGRMRERFMGGIPLEGKVVLDVGGGLGGRAPYFALNGAERVACIDINQQELAAGAAILRQRFPELTHRIDYLHPGEVRETGFADVAILADVFEHLTEPEAVLRQCHDWLRPGGVLWIGSIGWYNYMASHCLFHIPIPWCQVLFSERALIGTIRRIIKDPRYTPLVWERLEGVTRWDQVRTLKDRPGEPLNMLSLRGVRKILDRSPFQVTEFKVHGFGGARNRLFRLFSFLSKLPIMRELFHSYYTAVLTRPTEG